MVRTAKTEKPSAPLSAPVVSTPTDASTSAPVKKEKKTKKVSDVVEVATPVVSLETAPSNEIVVESDASSLAAKMTEFSAKLQQLNSIFSAVKGDFKTLEKVISRELKAAQKSSGKKTKRAGNRAPSGFVKPTLISDELATFLGKSAGTEMARTAVSKEINTYIRNNNLQDKNNGRIIVPDAKLATLLKTQPSDELTYFNLQRFMKHHFVKAEPAATA
jgi:chromatin remodeling complex protein RSC6